MWASDAAGLACLASNRRQGIDQRLEDHRIVAMDPCDAEHQRDALAIRDEVAPAAEFALVRGIRPCVRAPGGWERWLYL